jgi:putative heme uptake system protein
VTDPIAPPAPELTYLLLDGENLDMALGSGLLGRRPAPEERPRWERVLEFTERLWAAPVTPLFFMNASSGNLPMSFIQAIRGFGYRPVPLSGPPSVKVVDVGIQRTLEAIAERDAHVMLGSHDGDFLPQIERLLGGTRRVGLLAFRELVNQRYVELADRGLELFDLEDDARCFNQRLPRLRIIDIDAFDPADFL